MEQKNNAMIPLAILAAGVIIAGAIYYRGEAPSGGNAAAVAGAKRAPTAEDLAKARPVDTSDHRRGPATAPVVIIEYSDLECPFCKTFHNTLREVMDESAGQIAWVYRHLPLESLHEKARAEAEASECAAEQGGDEAFWAFIDEVFATTPSNDGFDLATLPAVAQKIGLDRAQFEACIASDRHEERITADAEEATTVGAQGTPFSIAIGPTGKRVAIPGAFPKAAVKQMIASLLDNQNDNAAR